MSLYTGWLYSPLIVAGIWSFVFLPKTYASSCEKIQCESGKSFPSCSLDGHTINYIANPCHTEFAQIYNRTPFSDVLANDPYTESIRFAFNVMNIKGYGDGTFRPDHSVSRAEFIKMVMGIWLEGNRACQFQRSFADVPEDAWYANNICIALEDGLVRGYADQTFRPAAKISLAEVAQILAKMYDAKIEESVPWYRDALTFIAEKHAIPSTLESPMQYVSRAEAIEILWRLNGRIEDRTHAEKEDIFWSQCVWSSPEKIPGVDMEEVERAWSTWVNDLRLSKGLNAYSRNRQLLRTARIWSEQAKQKGSISHTRPGQTVYYDYPLMEQWFFDLGLTFANVNRNTFTENIGWGRYSCKKNNCTGALIEAIRSTFNYFIAEEGKAYRPHWNSMVNPSFTQMGIGISVDQSAGKYYLTAHYGTSITSKPQPVCP